MTVTLEDLQARVAQGEKVDLEQLTRLSNSQARALATLRKARPRPPAPVVVNPAVQAAPARPPTIAEVAAEQVRRAVKPAVVVIEPAGPGPDLTELGDDELERLKVYLREVGGDAQ